MNKKTGILLINIGTPDAPTASALRVFLSEFLSDPYIVDYPRWLWKFVLERIILRKRPEKSALLYKKIWTKNGSPLLTNMKSIADKLGENFQEDSVIPGMRYGNPSIAYGLNKLREIGANHLVVFPLFAQFSSTTSQTAIESTLNKIENGHHFEKVTIIKDYHDHPAYIRALVDNIEDTWAREGKPEKLLFSYHGVPRRYIHWKGEPYKDQCEATTRLAAEALGLAPSEYEITYQSKFGPEPWLGPATVKRLENHGKQSCSRLHVVCPGFAVDCLETLEEIAIRGKEVYEQAGGKNFHYIPALNDHDGHITALNEIITDSIG